MNNSLSLVKIISGLSRTLNVARQLIPLYKQVKPILYNSSKVLNNISNSKVKDIDNNIVQENIISNQPTFFQ